MKTLITTTDAAIAAQLLERQREAEQRLAHWHAAIQEFLTTNPTLAGMRMEATIASMDVAGCNLALRTLAGACGLPFELPPADAKRSPIQVAVTQEEGAFYMIVSDERE